MKSQIRNKVDPIIVNAISLNLYKPLKKNKDLKGFAAAGR